MTTRFAGLRGAWLWAALVSVGCGSAVIHNPDGGAGAGGAAAAAGAAGHGAAGGQGGAGAGAAGGNAGAAAGNGGAGGAPAGGAAGAASGGAGGHASGGAGGAASGGTAGGGAGGANACANGVRDGAETDVDCGGGTCGKCDVNKVCAADGDCKTGSCSRLFCALVSGPPNWLTGPSLANGRGFVFAGIAVGSGQWTLYVNGGRDDSDDTDPALSSYEALYSGPGEVWSPYVNDVSTLGPTATDAAGDMLVFSSTSTWQMSFPRTWKMLSAVMPTPRDLAGAAPAPNGLVYVAGGQVGGAASGVVEAYDPVMNKWTAGLRAMPTPRFNLAAALGADGLIYAIGGETDLNSVATVESYDSVSNTWSTKSALPASDDHLAAVSAPDGRIYALGGRLGTINAYTPATNRWTTVTPLSDSRTGVGAAVTPDGHIWAIGGTTNPEITGEATVQVYGPSVSASPTMGPPGTSVSVTGSNFAASATVSVYFTAVSGSPLATGSTDANGKLTSAITLKVPSLAGGAQPLIVIDDRSQYPITISFQVQ
jgi:hypothetical protein